MAKSTNKLRQKTKITSNVVLTLLVGVLVIATSLIINNKNFQSLIGSKASTSQRVLKYYGLDRARPVNDSTYAKLAGYNMKTVIISTFINDASNDSGNYNAKWATIKTEADKYGFNYVIWPDQGGDIARCGWEDPFDSPTADGNYIWRVTNLLDSLSTDPNFIGIVIAHEPMYNVSKGCHSTIADMTATKKQIKDYMHTKGRDDFKVWSYIDNVSDLASMAGYQSADIANVMDVAVTWQHCFGTNEGSCMTGSTTKDSQGLIRNPGTYEKILNDRTLINKAGLDGKVELVFLLQTFSQGSDYRMPTADELMLWSCQFMSTGALDGFMYYTWGAGPSYNWYSADLQTDTNLQSKLNNVYSTCIIGSGLSNLTSTPTLASTSTPTTKPTNTLTPIPTNSPTVKPTPTLTNTPTIKPTFTPTPKPTLTPTVIQSRPTPVPVNRCSRWPWWFRWLCRP